ncbi:MAG TPA: FlgO family outer membrane protein [Thermoanaerobaculia bacterium]|nr:FlgO family outer membrane protein [Thermoanaerobaculia bacterium]
MFFVVLAFTVLPASPAFAYEKEIKELATDLSKMIKASGKRAVAVVDFTDLEGNTTALGRFLAEELSNSLAGCAKDFDVIDRNHLNTLMREQQLTSSGLLNRLMTRKLEVDGVQALVTGSLTPFGEEEVRVSVKILDVSTAKMLGVNQVNLTQNATIKNMMRQGIAANEVTTTQQSGSKPVAPSGKTAAKSKATSLAVEEGEEESEAEPQLVAETGRFQFEVQSCVRQNQRVDCRIAVLNEGGDRELGIKKTTRAFDDRGDEYYAGRGQIASAVVDFEDYNWVENQVLNGVPTMLTVSFDRFASDLNSLRALQLVGSAAGNSFSLTFQNIPVGAKGALAKGKGASGGGGAGGGGGILSGLKQMLTDTALDVARDQVNRLKPKSKKTDDRETDDDQ